MYVLGKQVCIISLKSIFEILPVLFLAITLSNIFLMSSSDKSVLSARKVSSSLDKLNSPSWPKQFPIVSVLVVSLPSTGTRSEDLNCAQRHGTQDSTSLLDCFHESFTAILQSCHQIVVSWRSKVNTSYHYPYSCS